MDVSYKLIIYRNKDGELRMDVRQGAVYLIKSLKIPNIVYLVDGENHRDDGHVVGAFDIDMFRKRGLMDFFARINRP